MPLTKEKIAKALPTLPQEHICERLAERIFNDMVPRYKKLVVEMRQDLSHEHFQELVMEQ